MRRNLKPGRKRWRRRFGNPLYHWTHLELKKYFDCDTLLDSHNWREVMDRCNRLIASDDFLPRALITRSNVEVICTTDGPLDSLEYHRLLQQDDSFATRVLPTFRPDEVFIPHGASFSAFIDKLATLTGREIQRWNDFDAPSRSVSTGSMNRAAASPITAR